MTRLRAALWHCGQWFLVGGGGATARMGEVRALRDYLRFGCNLVPTPHECQGTSPLPESNRIV